MSPEQARGEPATPSSDMYSFGLLLQKLFATQGPYEDGLDQTALLEKARNGETLPPVGADKELAALIERLKSLAPTRRPTAVETTERLRWIGEKPRRRLRNLVVAGVVVALGLAGLKYTVDLARERTIATQRREQAENLIDFMLGDLRAKLEPVGRLEILDNVGDEALEYFASVPEGDLTDEELFRHSQSLNQIGSVRMAQGNLEPAMKAFRESLTLAETLAARDERNEEWLAGLGASHFWVGNVLWMQGDLDSAYGRFETYLGIAEQLVAMRPQNLEWELELAQAHNNLGAVLAARGDTKLAREKFATAIHIMQGLVASDPDDTSFQRDLADNLSWLGEAMEEEGDVIGALAQYRSFLDIFEQLSAQEPENAQWSWHIGVAHHKVGQMLAARGELAEAQSHFVSDVEICRRMAASDPENADWQRSLALSMRRLVLVELHVQENRRAAARLEESLGILQTLRTQDPSNAERQRDLAAAHLALARTYEVGRAFDRGRQHAAAALDILEPLLEEHAEDREAQRLLGEGLLWMGTAAFNTGQPGPARKLWEESLAVVAPMASASSRVEWLETWARVLIHLERPDEAEPIVRRMLAGGYRHPEFIDFCRSKGVRFD